MATKRSEALASKLKEAGDNVSGELKRTTEHVSTRIEAMRRRIENADRRHDPRVHLKVGGSK